MEELDLPQQASIMVCVGKPRSGKTFLIKTIMRAYAGHFKFGIAITKTKFTGDWSWLPDQAVWPDYEEDKLRAYIEKLRNYRAKTKGKELPPNFVLMDDLLGVVNLNGGWFSSWISTFRHTNTHIFLLTQFLTRGVSTVLRECTDMAFIFRTIYRNSLDALFEAYGGMCENFQEFKQLLLNATEKPYHCLVYRAERPKEETYGEYVAAPVKDFKLNY